MNLNEPMIAVDLDGVCADFEKFYNEAFEHRHDSVSDEIMWKNINAHGKFFNSLPLIEGTIEFINRFKKTHELVILTACPKSDYQRAALQKKEWVKTYIDPDIKVLPVLGGKNKFLFMQRPGDVLIDDFDKNIKPWIENGGFGIVHTDWETTSETLSKYLYTKEYIARNRAEWGTVEYRLEGLANRLSEEGRYTDADICFQAHQKLKGLQNV